MTIRDFELPSLTDCFGPGQRSKAIESRYRPITDSLSNIARVTITGIVGLVVAGTFYGAFQGYRSPNPLITALNTPPDFSPVSNLAIARVHSIGRELICTPLLNESNAPRDCSKVEMNWLPPIYLCDSCDGASVSTWSSKPHLKIDPKLYANLKGDDKDYPLEEADGVIAHELCHLRLNHLEKYLLPREREFEADMCTTRVPNMARGLVKFFRRWLADPAEYSKEKGREEYLDLASPSEKQWEYPTYFERIDALNHELCRLNPAIDPDYDFGICSALGINQCDS
jgi:hypothetical protein